mmetsp:Transcript_23917/g.56503  ORF Transcript_23917/g.56503 Transcript_23917/m.56503 type:complete len:90 (-) Transcript_23917:491-760(-)
MAQSVIRRSKSPTPCNTRCNPPIKVNNPICRQQNLGNASHTPSLSATDSSHNNNKVVHFPASFTTNGLPSWHPGRRSPTDLACIRTVPD